MTNTTTTPLSAIRGLLEICVDLDVTPGTFTAHGPTPIEPRPTVRIVTRCRTDFEALCQRLRLKPVERQYSPRGQRAWSAEGDTDERRLLVEGVSFAHQDDWTPR